MQRRASHRVPLVDGDADLLTNGECRAQDFLAAALRRRVQHTAALHGYHRRRASVLEQELRGG